MTGMLLSALAYGIDNYSNAKLLALDLSLADIWSFNSTTDPSPAVKLHGKLPKPAIRLPEKLNQCAGFQAECQPVPQRFQSVFLCLHKGCRDFSPRHPQEQICMVWPTADLL